MGLKIKNKIKAILGVLSVGLLVFTITPKADVLDSYPINQHTPQLNIANRQYYNQGYGQAINYYVADGLYDEYVTSGNQWNITYNATSKTHRYYVYFIDWDTPINRCAIQLLGGGQVVAISQFIPTNSRNEVVLEFDSTNIDTIKLIVQQSGQESIGRIILYDADIYDLYSNDVNDAYNEGVQIGSGAKVEPSIINLFGSLAQVPITILGSMMSFEVLGQKYFTIFASFLSIALVLWILKKVL